MSAGARLRSLVDGLGARGARLLVSVFFRDIRVEGEGHLAAAPGPLLLVANHVNSLIDPILICGFVRRQPRFLAKSTLWRHPVVGPLVMLMGSIPVYRRQDDADVRLNFDSFARARDALCAGGTVALFPEGRSHNETQPLPLKTGAARIALQAESHHAGAELRIVPLGITYENKGKFRSRVVLRIGVPIDPGVEAQEYGTTPRAAVRSLTTRIAAGLLSVTPATEWKRGYSPRPLRQALLFPAAAVGAVLNWLPYRLPGWVSRALSRTADEPATYKLLTALIAFPLAWTAEAALAAAAWGPWAALLVALVAPPSGYAALLFWEGRPAAAGPFPHTR